MVFPPAGGATRLQNVSAVYGVPAVTGLAAAKREEVVKKLAGVKAVFVPPDGETIRFFKDRGFLVFISVNAFGGTEAWRKYPDARPVLANGRYLDEKTGGRHGGVCPTHGKWREERLRTVEELFSSFSGPAGIDGLWLDFLRYPGVWEKGEEKPPARDKSPRPARSPLPDTCYCPRCLAKFSSERQIALPSLPGGAAALAAWIGKNYPYEWMAWKKEQILSFARDVRKVRERFYGAGIEAPGPDKSPRPLLLKGEKVGGALAPPPLIGAFVVPWTKGERDGAVSFLLGQDAFALSGIVDVLSPMVYHRMVSKPASWTGDMTFYYAEQSQSPLWPILQSGEVTPAEFARTVRLASLGGAEGIMAYSFAGMEAAKTAALASFRAQENMVPDAGFRGGEESWRAQAEGRGQDYGPHYAIKDSTAILPPGKADPLAPEPFRMLALRGGSAVAGEWSAALPACEPGETYQFSCLFFRDTWSELSSSYVSLWGESFLLEKHSPPGMLQPLRVRLTCPETPTGDALRFTNGAAGDFFYFGKPKLVKTLPTPAPLPHAGYFYPHFFPMGLYGAKSGDLEAIKKLALNTVIVGGDGEPLREMVQAAREQGLRYVLSSPHDPERLKVYLDRLAAVPGLAAGEGPAFYVDDEPEMRAVPTGRSADMQRLIKGRFPRAATGMATVRPAYVREYLPGSDFFMIDNYPFPNLPMSWLGDAMDRAARDVSRDRLLSVIQAFADGDVWPSLPGWQQMDCLAFLSIVHGSRGIFFYTWSVIGKTGEGRANLGRVAGRLNKIYPWLLEKNLERPVTVEMLSRYRMDPEGRPAVQAGLKRKGGEMMLIAVNTIGAPVETRLAVAGLPGARPAREAFSDAAYPVRDGVIQTKLKAYETKAFIFREGGAR